MPDRNAGGRPPRTSREQVVDVGLEILRDEGLAAVTLGAIGERLGLHKVALYTYVKSKDDLLLAMRDEVYRRQLEALQDEGELAPEVALKAMCGRLLALMNDYGALMVTVEPALQGPGMELGERFLEVLAGVGLPPRQQLQVYVLLSSLLLSSVTMPAELTEGSRSVERVRRAVADEGQFPRMRALFEALPPTGTPLSSVTDDALALIIDVLIPAVASTDVDASSAKFRRR